MPALVHFYLGTFVHVAMGRFVTLICTVRFLVANQTLVDAVSIGAHKLSWIGTRGIFHFRWTSILIRMIPTVILTVAAELFPDAFKVVTRKLLAGARFVFRVAELSFVATVATIIVMIAQPILIQTAAVFAGELIICTGNRCRTMVHSHILISSVDTVRISIAQPLLRNALSPVPDFIRCTGEFGLFVTFPVVTLMPFILVRIIQAVIVPITDVHPWNAVTIIASEQVSKAGSAF